MLETFSIFPSSLSGIDSGPQDGLQGARYVLERVVDASGTAAALCLWEFWQRHGTDGSALTVPHVSIAQSTPYHALTSAQIYVGEGLETQGLETQGIKTQAERSGCLLFSDLSVLVFTQLGETFTFLPVVFRMPWILMTRHGAVRLCAIQHEHTVSLKLQSCEPADVSRKSRDLVRAQIDRETLAWATLIPHMPGLRSPTPEAPEGNWPSFFPREVCRSKDLAAFRQDAIDAVQSIMAWMPGAFLQAQVSAWSSRPLQAGFEPLRLAVNWQKAPEHIGCKTEKLKDHLIGLLFSENTPWDPHDFPGCRLSFETPDTACSVDLQIFTENVFPPHSNHERLKLMKAFPPPPS